ncbi:MAG: polyhydroxyalkanoate granule-associated phasin [Candidatus Contendobacter sp.]
MSSRHNRKTNSLVAKAAELAFAVPQVVAHRVTRMAIAGPSLSERDRKEFQRMCIEKTAAFGESWNAMTLQALRAHQALAASFLRSFWSPSLKGRPSASAVAAQWHSAALGVLDKGLAPVHRTAVANAKRLARTKLR